MNKKELSQRILPLIDLTSLNYSDNEAVIKELCAKATTSYGNVAAVCIYPKFVSLAKKILLGTNVNIATVANFPNGDQELEVVVSEIKQAIAAGANEIDVVIPYKDYIAGNIKTAKELITACRKACGSDIHLKVILETGALKKTALITAASFDAIAGGADFIKTSTGKTETGATITAAKTMLLAIRDTQRQVGFKASGGIRTVEQAAEYLQLADQIMGPNWVNSATFRFGASSLLDDVLSCLTH